MTQDTQIATQTPSSRKFGVEIETYGLSNSEAASVMARFFGAGEPSYTGGVYGTYSVSDRQGRIWKCQDDASIQSSTSSEIVTPPLCGGEDIDLLQGVIRALRNAGAKSDAARGCGIHVHVDGAGLTPKAVAALATMVHKYDGLLEKALQNAERRRWCRVIPEDTLRRLRLVRPNQCLDDINAAWYGCFNSSPTHYDREFNTRYRGLNLHSLFFRGTIEFRWFNGTLHAGEIKAYLQFCLALVARAETKSMPRLSVRAVDGGSKYYFRLFLLDLGLVGDGYKTCRRHLLKNLEGSAAWPGARRVA